MNRVLLKNICSLLGIQGMNYIIPLITLPYLVKTLGPESYGVLGFSYALIQYFSRFTDYGFNLTATKDIALDKTKDNVSRVFWSVLVCKFILVVLSTIILFTAIEFNEFLKEQQQIIWLSFGMVIGSFIFPIWLFQGLERMGWIAISNIGSRLIAIPFIFLYVNQAADTWLAALITSLTSILAGLISFYFILKYKWIKFIRISCGDILKQFQSGFHLFLSTSAVSLYTTSIPVFLGFISGPVAVGYYIAADKLRLAVQGIISPISQAVYPRIIDMLSKDREKARRFIKKLFILQGCSTFILAVVVIILSKYIINFLYGIHYNESITVLWLLSPTIFLVGVSNVLGTQVLLTLNYKVIYSKIVMLAAFLNLIIIFPLIYLLSEKGAAMAVLLTELFVVLLMYINIKRLDIKI